MELKKEYNELLKRYYAGCEYCSNHIKEANKWLPELLKILDNINLCLDKIKANEGEINDFEIEEGFYVG